MFRKHEKYQTDLVSFRAKLDEKHGYPGSPERKKFLEKIANNLKKSCSPQVALMAIKNKGIKKAMEEIDKESKKSESGFIYLFTQAIKELPYKEAINILLSNYDSFTEATLKVTINQLENNPKFKTEFTEDNSMLPFFGRDLLIRLKESAEKNKSIVSACELVENRVSNNETDKTFAFTSISKLYGFPENQAKLTNQQKAVIEAALFLNDCVAVEEQLGILEKKLEEKLGEDFDKKKKILIGYDLSEKAKTPRNKLLNTIYHEYLSEWARENNFQSFTKLYKNLPSDTFFDVLKKGSLIIDSSERITAHGQWTHLLQIMCLVEHDKKNGNKILSAFAPKGFITWLGEQEGDIWEKTFDNVFDTTTAGSSIPRRGYRDPLNLEFFLLSDECAKRFPCLHQFIKGHKMMGKAKDHNKPYESAPIENKLNK